MSFRKFNPDSLFETNNTTAANAWRRAKSWTWWTSKATDTVSWEWQLLDLYHDVMVNGSDRIDRTGVGTRSRFGTQIEIDLQDGFPMVTTKFQSFKSVAAELLWFLEGSSDERRLAEITHGTRDPAKRTIWTDNAAADYWKPKAEFEGDLGRVYGVQWRNWTNKNGETFDQLAEVVRQLKEDPYSRRIIMTAWNPGELHLMALPPCHVFVQFYVDNIMGRPHLSCKLYQRSIDGILGKPYNITSYALLVHMIAHLVDMDVGKLIMTDGDSHIYSNHFDAVKTQLGRVPKDPPQLIIKNPGSIKSISDFTLDSFEIVGYVHDLAIKAPMAV